MPWTTIVMLLATQAGGDPLAPNTNCRSCHTAGATASVSMSYDSHQGSLMDLSGVDPFFLAAWEIARADDSTASTLCASCHYPGATAAGRQPTGLNLQPATASDLDGVACDLCHRFSPDVDSEGEPVMAPLMGNAVFTLGQSEPKLGPFGSDDARGHTSTRGPLAERSETCGQCHDVTNVLLTRYDAPVPELEDAMPLERTFREWTQSAFARPGPDAATCQDCHMPARVGSASNLPGSPDDRVLRDHRIVGSTTRAPMMIARYPDVLGDLAPPVSLGLTPFAEATRDAALALLRAAATLTPLVEDDEVVLRVENRSGHKLPTGYAEGRRMWLEVARVDEDGTCTPLGGAWSPQACELVPEPAAPRIWEAVLGVQGEKSFHFALVDTVVADNRIPPPGFAPDRDTGPVGHDYPVVGEASVDGEPRDVLAHWDDVRVGEVPDEGAVFEARLLFQSSSAEFLRFLVEGAPEAGALLADLFLAAGPYQPEVMATVRFRVDADGAIELLEGAPRCLSELVGPPEPCLGLEAPPVLDDVPDEPPPETAVDVDGPEEGGCRCVSAPRPTGGALALCGLLLCAGRLRRRRALGRARP